MCSDGTQKKKLLLNCQQTLEPTMTMQASYLRTQDQATSARCTTWPNSCQVIECLWTQDRFKTRPRHAHQLNTMAPKVKSSLSPDIQHANDMPHAWSTCATAPSKPTLRQGRSPNFCPFNVWPQVVSKSPTSFNPLLLIELSAAPACGSLESRVAQT